MRTVARAVKVGVVLVNAYRPACRLAEHSRRAQKHELAGGVVEYELVKGPAFGGRILGMAVVVVEPGAVRQNTVRADLVGRAVRLAGVALGVLRVYGQPVQAKAAQVGPRRFIAVIPAGEAGPGVAAHEGDRVFDLIVGAAPLDGEPVLRLDSGKNKPGRRIRVGRAGVAHYTRKTRNFPVVLKPVGSVPLKL